MSNDLISRSAAIEEFYKRISGDFTYEEVKCIENILENIPAAYDVDKIVKRLEEYPTGMYKDEYGKGFSAAINIAIKIVKEGGENE